jgi:hypothetical protein
MTRLKTIYGLEISRDILNLFRRSHFDDDFDA